MKLLDLSSDNPLYIEYYQKKLIKIKNLYEKGSSCTTIAKQLNMSRNDVAKFLKKEDIKIDPNRHKHIFSIKDENIFENIDTSEKAQILGLIYADGCIYKNYNITNITLKEDDLDYLNNINNYLGYSRPVSLEKKSSMRFFKENQKYYKIKNAYAIRINNLKIKTDLMKHGINYYKSYTNFPFPKLENRFLNSFILGYFEGDGCVTISPIKNRKCHYRSFSILCQPLFADALQKIFKDVLEINCKIYTKKARPNLRTVSITKATDLIKLYEWLYKDATFCMKRKHDIFCSIMDELYMYGYEIGKRYTFD